MQITKDRVVAFHYRLSEPGVGPIEESHGGEPVVYLHGHGGLIAGLEKAMEGHGAGDTFAVTVSPEEGYGPRDENAQQRIPKSHVIGGKGAIFRPGMAVRVNTPSGQRTAVVVKVGLKMLDVDTNHPLAGRTLHFDIEVVSVREAHEEEIAHGHAHGVGGHAH
ncbi:MAG: peptidylprolyl isomerase [Gammaproteobacteria bacterium]|jgi:FKBP-type peptidyl-prolyl cis-trans isomerase SlyD|nr:peptidylprolyl isomerase [Gammaproteobacteria bacterium]